MDRLQFIGQTHEGPLATSDTVIRFFDHTMAAYEIIGGINGVTVKGEPDNFHSLLKIYVDSPETSELEEVVDYVNNTIHNQEQIYGKSFKINACIDGPHAELFVYEEYTTM